MVVLLLLTLGIVLSLLHFCLAKSNKSRLRKPCFVIILYKYWLFFAVGSAGIYYGIERMYYAYQLAAGFHTPLSASLQNELGLYCLSLGILGLLAPFATRGFRLAVIINYSLFTLSVAGLQLFEIVPTENYSFTTLQPIYYGFIAPLALIILFFISDKKQQKSSFNF